MDYPEQVFICERCSQLCYRPVIVHLGPKDLRICFRCFEDAVARSGGVVTNVSDATGESVMVRLQSSSIL